MRVLQINAVYGIGSTGTIVKDIQSMCLKNKIDCYVAYQKTNSAVPNGYKVGNWFSYKLHAILCRIAGKQAYFSRISTWLLDRYIDRLQPDIVNLHNLHSNYVNLNMLLRHLAKRNIKTVVTLHDCWFYTGGCYHYTNAKCDKWKLSCGGCPKKMQDTKAFLYDSSTSILNDRKKYFSLIPNLTVVGVSDWIRKEATKSVFRDIKSYTIYNGIDTNILYPRELIKEKFNLTGKIVMMGPASKWLDPINNDALQYFIKHMKGNEILFLIGCSKYKDLPDNIVQFQYTSNREELASLYSMADVFVNCTREESLSMINLEAQACGTPVVTYDGTGVQETVDGISGKAVHSGNYKELYEAASYYAYKIDNRADYNCVNFIRSKFSMQEKYQQYIDLYISLITEKYL